MHWGMEWGRHECRARGLPGIRLQGARNTAGAGTIPKLHVHSSGLNGQLATGVHTARRVNHIRSHTLERVGDADFVGEENESFQSAILTNISYVVAT